MKDSKLTFKLERFHSILVFEVLNQCSSITNRVVGKSLKFVSTNNVEIKSFDSVSIYEDTIYLGGVSERTGADVIIFDSPEEAEKIKQDFLYALSEWAKNGYFSFGRASDKLIPDSDGVYRL